MMGSDQPQSVSGDARLNRAEVPVSPMEHRFQKLEGQLEHVAQLVLRLPHFASRVDNVCDKLAGSRPQDAEVARSERPGVPPGHSVHSQLDRLSEVLNLIASDAEHGLALLAETVDRLDDCV